MARSPPPATPSSATTRRAPLDHEDHARRRGYKIEGRKAFGTLTPVWTRIGFHAMDSTDLDAPRIVHGFLPHDSDGFRIEETWDALGMRAPAATTPSLRAASCRRRRSAASCRPGRQAWICSCSASLPGRWGVSSVYYSIARRVVDLTLENPPKKTSLALLSGSYAHRPEYQHGSAEMIFKLDPLLPHIESVLEGYSEAVLNAPNWTEADPPHWGGAVISLKKTVTERAFEIADLGIELAGGLGVVRKNEFERLFRDARMGRIHPASSPLAYESVSKFALGGVGLRNQRWG